MTVKLNAEEEATAPKHWFDHGDEFPLPAPHHRSRPDTATPYLQTSIARNGKHESEYMRARNDKRKDPKRRSAQIVHLRAPFIR